MVAALKCLTQGDHTVKAAWTKLAYDLWRAGELALPAPGRHHGLAPVQPGRDPAVRLVPPSQLPRRGKGGSLASRQALLHSLVHIEGCAVDLAWDVIARFGADPAYGVFLPHQFFDDWVQVAEDEARHFSALLARLRASGGDYGALPAHAGLWETAMETAGSLPARLAVEHAVHEARGLDVLPQTIARFRAGGDAESAQLLEDVIYAEEISHCGAGVRWLKHLHAAAPAAARDGDGEAPAWAADAAAHPTVEAWFQALVRRHFHGPLKPPFNVEARRAAGFLPEWYEPLAAA